MMDDKHYSTNPSSTTDQWYVWDIYAGVPPKPIFFGSMEDAGLVADALNERAVIIDLPTI